MTTSFSSVSPDLTAGLVAGNSSARAPLSAGGAASAETLGAFGAIFAAQSGGEGATNAVTPAASAVTGVVAPITTATVTSAAPTQSVMQAAATNENSSGFVNATSGRKVLPTADSVDGVSEVGASEIADGKQQAMRAPTRAETEAALALLAPVWLAASPTPVPTATLGVSPQASANEGVAAPTREKGQATSESPVSAKVSATTPLAVSNATHVSVSLAGRAPVEISTVATSSVTQIASDIVARWNADFDAANDDTASPASAPAPMPTPGALAESALPTRHGPRSGPTLMTAPEAAIPLRAEVVLRDGVRVTAEVGETDSPFALPAHLPLSNETGLLTASATPDSRRAGASVALPDTRVAGPAISAAEIPAENAATSARAMGEEKNILSARRPEVKSAAKQAGIAVAQERAVMPELASVSPASVAASPAMTLPATVAVAAPVATEVSGPSVESLAHRAVETVEAVVDAQATSRLQPTPGVSLRFRVGEQDLAVRIELRAGEVHTEFRTESPELRQAVAHEWRAMVARSDAPVRMIEPVFTSNHDANASGQSFAQSQHHHSQHQQAQQQHAMLRDVPAELFGRVGRRLPGHAADPSAAAPIVSLSPQVSNRRLSAVA